MASLFTGCQAQPKLSGYAQNINMGTKLTQAGGQTFPYYLHFYFTANDTTLYVGAVTNFTGWVAVALSAQGSMITGGFSDAIVSYYDSSSSTMEIKDLSLSAKGVGTPTTCYNYTGVCADEDKKGCTNNVQLIGHTTNGTYNIWEFTRPLAASDACDRAVPTGSSSGYVISSAGFFDGSGSYSLPYNMQTHTYRTSSGFQNSFQFGAIPISGSTTSSTSTSGTSMTTGSTSSSTVSTGTSSSVSTGTTGTTGGATTGTVSTTGGSTTGPIQCTKDISQQCLDVCSPKFVDYCRCNITTNTLVYICKDTASMAVSFATPAFWMAIILGLVALLQ